MRTGFTGYFVSALLSAGWMGGDWTQAHGQEPGKKPSAEAHIPATAEEPLAKEFSLERAARSLDASALAWNKESRPWVAVGCSQCHANLMYLIARPLLAEIVPPPPDVRAQYESLAEQGGGMSYATAATVVGVPLAFHDRQTTGKLHPQTRKMLDLMLSRQRPDGGWTNIGGGPNPVINDYEETLLAALGVAHAPEGYAQTAAAQKALAGIRKYIKGRPAKNAYEQGMLLWAARHVEGLMTDAERDRAVADLLALQHADGGWALERLTLGNDKKDSDGYGTGFVIFVARQAGVKADDARLQKGIAWLKSNQRESGRWFTRSPGGSKQNLHSNAGTAFAVLALHACGEITVASGKQGEDWPQFRGPEGQGHSAARGLPLTWSETENITWKAAIPGLGWSSPVIQGKQIWLTTALDDGRSLHALCLDRATGKLLHDVAVFPKNIPSRLHSTNSHASPTPFLEGDRVYVHYGSYGTACLTTAGKVVWTTQMPHAMSYGPSSTPVLYDDLLIVPCHGTDVRYLAALDKKTGEVRWKQSHDGRHSEATPLVIQAPGGDQLIANLAERVVAYDPRTGREIWSVQQGDNYAQVSRPVYGHGLVFVCGGYFSPVLHAIRPDGRGDVTKTHVAWSLNKAVPQNPSPLLVGNELYLVNDKGICSCLDARSGKLHWSERLGGAYYASPLYADGRIYFLNDSGETTVIAPGVSFKKLASNKLEGRSLASLAVSGKAIYFRTDHHLYQIEKK
jgi:outer membrane protein assembly factor BamB